MKQILLTGANGLLGSQIAKRLIRNGYSVRAIKRNKSDLRLLGEDVGKIEWIEGDVRDIVSLEAAMIGVSTVIHCAAMISFVPEDAEAMMQINAEGTANVVDAALRCGVKKLIHISSVAAFCRPKGVALIDEHLDIKDSKDNFNYFRSKFYGEREAWRGLAEGLEVSIVCPSTILGGGFWDMEPNKLFAQIHKGYPFYTTGVNGFVDVRDVADVVLLVLEKEVVGEKFIVSSENVCFNDLMWMIADALGVKRARFKTGRWLGAIAWRGEWLLSKITGKRALVTREVIEMAMCDFRYDNRKVSEELGFVFRPVAQTVKDVAALYNTALEKKSSFSFFS